MNDNGKKKTKERPIGNNKKLPFEHQVMWVLRNYDQMARENRLLRHYLGQIPVSIVEQYNTTARENGRLMKVTEAQEQEIKRLGKKVAKLKEHITQYKKQLESVKEEKAILSRNVAAYVLQAERPAPPDYGNDNDSD